MIDFDELKKKGHIKEGQLVRVKLKQSKITTQGTLEEIADSFIIMKPLETEEEKEAQEKMSDYMDDHVLSHLIINKQDVKYLSVMKKLEKKKKPNQNEKKIKPNETTKDKEAK